MSEMDTKMDTKRQLKEKLGDGVEIDVCRWP